MTYLQGLRLYRRVGDEEEEKNSVGRVLVPVDRPPLPGDAAEHHAVQQRVAPQPVAPVDPSRHLAGGVEPRHGPATRGFQSSTFRFNVSAF